MLVDGYALPALEETGNPRRSAPRRRTKLGILSALAVVFSCFSAALATPGSNGTPRCPEAEIHVYKDEGTLELLCSGAVSRSFPVTFGADPVGPKEREGDEKTPEGKYRVSSKLRDDRFHRFLGVSYPNTEDIQHAKAAGIANPGGGIGIHGTKTSRAALARIWIRLAHETGAVSMWGPTDGCIAMTNEDVETLFDAVPVGARVVIAATR
jgi:murein L,D-transpeptidase YafK